MVTIWPYFVGLFSLIYKMSSFTTDNVYFRELLAIFEKVKTKLHIHTT